MPPAVNEGDLLLCFITYMKTPSGSFTLVTPSGWTKLWDEVIQTRVRGAGFAKIASGGEGGTNVDFATSVAVSAIAAQIYRVTNWYGSLSGVAVGTAAVATTANPNPPPLTHGWGAARGTLWFVACSSGPAGFAVTFYPSNYGNGDARNELTGGDFATINTARRQFQAASDDPGAFTLGSTDGAIAQTVAIRPNW
jgi:hypothetical protein